MDKYGVFDSIYIICVDGCSFGKYQRKFVSNLSASFINNSNLGIISDVLPNKFDIYFTLWCSQSFDYGTSSSNI